MLVLSPSPARTSSRGWRAGPAGHRGGRRRPGWATVRIDDDEAARIATRHLLGLGHRRIAYIGGRRGRRPGLHCPAARLTGFHAALAEAGLRPEDALEADGSFTVAGGMRAAEELLPPRPTDRAFAASDEMAFGVLRAARALGLQVPEDVSVIGIDDHEMAAIFDLTTVAQPCASRAGSPPSRSLAALSAQHWAPQQVVLPTRLVRPADHGRPAGQRRTYLRSAISRPAARPLRSNSITGRSAQRSVRPPRAAARRRGPRPSGRRSRPSRSLAAATRRRAEPGGGEVGERRGHEAALRWRALCHGSGRTSRPPAVGLDEVSIDQTASGRRATHVRQAGSPTRPRVS